MSDKQNLREKFNNCFLDLQRSAVSFYLNPEGKTHQVFLKHARRTLARIRNKKAREFSARISQIEKQTAHPSQDKNKRTNLADKILTLGCMLK